jgi:membrane associated rhomboid family serine protease
MTQRFLIYPVLLLVVLQLVPLLRGDRRWFAAQIAQLFVTALACLGGLLFGDEFVWVIIAWMLLVTFVVAPRLLARLAAQQQSAGKWKRAARLWRASGYLTFGRLGRLYRVQAAALRRLSEGHRQEAESLLEQSLSGSMPVAIRGIVHVWQLTLLHGCRDWERTASFYESVHDWGTLSAAMRARLLVARAFAETGQIERALRSLQLVALSPRTVGGLERQLWATRVVVAALAGDAPGIEDLLRRCDSGRPSRRRERFAAYWLGRCALTRGDRAEAARLFARSLELTEPRDGLWREAIAEQLTLAGASATETAEPASGENRAPATFAAQNPRYAHGWDVLEMAERQAAGWRALMHFGRPAPVTLTLLVILAAVYLADAVLFTGHWHSPLWLWAGNTMETIQNRQWWRVVTTLFLHANPLHLVMNGVALWMFGSAVEKTMGWWRFLAVFLVAGSLGNLLSALNVRYDVAVGASGGVFGLVGAFAVAVYQLDGPMYGMMRRRLLLLLALMVTVDLSIGWLEPQVDNLAHVGGFIAGVALAAGLRRPASARLHPRERAVDFARSR